VCSPPRAPSAHLAPDLWWSRRQTERRVVGWEMTGIRNNLEKFDSSTWWSSIWKIYVSNRMSSQCLSSPTRRIGRSEWIHELSKFWYSGNLRVWASRVHDINDNYSIIDGFSKWFLMIDVNRHLIYIPRDLDDSLIMINRIGKSDGLKLWRLYW
jgi:hypothetical protein